MGAMREDRTTIGNRGVPLETTYENIIDNVYILHPTGGYHYFSLCTPSKKINQIYRDNVWPWIETLPNDLGILEDTRYPRPTQRDSYPRLNLQIKKGKSYKINTAPQKTFYIHLLVARAFIPNEKKLPVVDHINSSSCDFRISNLRWATISENNSGNRPTIGPDKMYNVQHARDAV